jgi:hypothetical protein
MEATAAVDVEAAKDAVDEAAEKDAVDVEMAAATDAVDEALEKDAVDVEMAAAKDAVDEEATRKAVDEAAATAAVAVKATGVVDLEAEIAWVAKAAKDAESKEDIDGEKLSADEDDEGWSDIDGDDLGTCTHSRQSRSLFGTPDAVAPRQLETPMPQGKGALRRAQPGAFDRAMQAPSSWGAMLWDSQPPDAGTAHQSLPPVASTAPQSSLPVWPPVAKGGGKGKAAAAKPKALSKKDIPPGFKRCSTCLEALPESSFEDKRNVCKDDDLACESLQRVLRKKWGKNYKSRVTRVKKAGIWNQGVVAFRVSTQGQKRRVLPGAQDQLAEQSIKAHKKRRMSQRRE